MSLKPWSSRTGGSSKIKRQTWRGCDKFSLFMQMLMQQQGHSCFYVSFKKFVFASSFSSTFHSSSMPAWQDGANYKTFKTAILTIWSWSKKVFMYICPKKKILLIQEFLLLKQLFWKITRRIFKDEMRITFWWAKGVLLPWPAEHWTREGQEASSDLSSSKSEFDWHVLHIFKSWKFPIFDHEIAAR